MEKKGRPLIFNNVEELEKKIQEYWDYCEEREKPYTISGLAYYLNTTRQTIFNYSRRDDFAPIIERARDRVLMDTEERLQESGKNSTSGIIFSLKNNFKWTDKVEIESTNTNVNNNVDLSNLSVEEIRELLKDED